MSKEIFEAFLTYGNAKAVEEVAALGADAVPILRAILSGEARNDFGHPYRDLGALNCTLEAARRIGPFAKPLESYLREEVRRDWVPAVCALGELETLDEASLDAIIAATTSRNSDVAAEATSVLVKRGYADHPAVGAFAARTPFNARLVAGMRRQADENLNRQRHE